MSTFDEKWNIGRTIPWHFDNVTIWLYDNLIISQIYKLIFWQLDNWYILPFSTANWLPIAVVFKAIGSTSSTCFLLLMVSSDNDLLHCLVVIILLPLCEFQSHVWLVVCQLLVGCKWSDYICLDHIIYNHTRGSFWEKNKHIVQIDKHIAEAQIDWKKSW